MEQILRTWVKNFYENWWIEWKIWTPIVKTLKSNIIRRIRKKDKRKIFLNRNSKQVNSNSNLRKSYQIRRN